MGFLDFLRDTFGKKAVSMDSSVGGSFPVNMFDTGVISTSGQTVTEWTALRVATVLQCVTVLANGVSQIPFRLMQEGDRQKKDAKEHPLYWLFRERPNRWQSSVEFWNMVMIHLALQGEIVVWKIKVRGRVYELIPFAPGNYTITTEYSGGWAVNTYHLVKDDGSMVAVSEDEIWHLRWREYDLRVSLPQMSLIRDVVGIAQAGDTQAGSTLKNRSSITGIVHAKAAMTSQQRDEFKKNWEEAYGGPGNIGKNVFLGADLDFKPTTQTNADAQFIEQRKLQIEEICRCWNVNPLFAFSYDGNSSYNANEQMMLQHVVHTMAPWYRLIEESAYVNLLTEDERRKQGLYFAFNDAALLRADSKARAEFYRALSNIGAITPNEIREKEDLPPMEGGDKLYVQGAVVPLTEAGKWNKPSGGASSSSDSAGTPVGTEADNGN